MKSASGEKSLEMRSRVWRWETSMVVDGVKVHPPKRKRERERVERVLKRGRQNQHVINLLDRYRQGKDAGERRGRGAADTECTSSPPFVVSRARAASSGTLCIVGHSARDCEHVPLLCTAARFLLETRERILVLPWWRCGAAQRFRARSTSCECYGRTRVELTLSSKETTGGYRPRQVSAVSKSVRTRFLLLNSKNAACLCHSCAAGVARMFLGKAMLLSLVV